jgi:hypothetical protein
MKDYSEFPPIDSFKRVLTNSPQSALLYAHIWKNKKKCSRISLLRNEVKKKFLISPTLFRNHLLSLGRLELISFEETPEFFLIDFYEDEQS